MHKRIENPARTADFANPPPREEEREAAFFFLPPVAVAVALWSLRRELAIGIDVVGDMLLPDVEVKVVRVVFWDEEPAVAVAVNVACVVFERAPVVEVVDDGLVKGMYFVRNWPGSCGSG